MLPIYTTTAVQAGVLGDDLVTPPNRVFRYARNGSASLTPGTAVQAERPNESQANLACAAAAANATSITVTLGDAVNANDYAEGYVFINDESGEGFVYDILSHLDGYVSTAGTAATVALRLRDQVVVALTSSSQATLVKNLYKGVNPTEGEPWDIIAGVAPVAVAANEYFWVQVRGPAAVKQEGGLFAGRGVQVSQIKQGSVAVAKQVIPILRHTPSEGRIAGTRTELNYHSSETRQYQQQGIEQRFDYGTQRQEPDEVLTQVSGKATIPNRILGYCINPRVSEEFALIYLTVS